MALNGEESWLCLMCCNSDSESNYRMVTMIYEWWY